MYMGGNSATVKIVMIAAIIEISFVAIVQENVLCSSCLQFTVRHSRENKALGSIPISCMERSRLDRLMSKRKHPCYHPIEADLRAFRAIAVA